MINDIDKQMNQLSDWSSSRGLNSLSEKRSPDPKDSKINSMEKELKLAMTRIKELEAKIDNEGEVIQILNQTF